MKSAAAVMAVLLLLAVPALAGCSSSANESMAYDMPVDDAYISEDYDAMYDYGFDAGSTDGAVLNEAPKESESTESESASGSETAVERKIIRNADVEISADDANACYSAILEKIKTYGGYESNFNSRNNDYSGGTYVYIEAELRIPPEKLDQFISDLKNGDYGEISYCAVTSDEVTADYYDLATRLESKERALESYYALLEKAETVDEILSIQSRIDSITENIESIKGKLRLYDSLVDESTIYLDITQYTEKPVEEKEFEWDSLTGSDFLKLIKNGFLGVCNFVWSALQWIAILLISASPLLIIAGIILFIVIKARKRRAQKKAAAPVTASVSDDNSDETAATNAPDYK